MNRFIFIFIVLIFSGCHSFDADRGLNIFHYNQASGISSLDPAFASVQSNMWAVSQLYNGLVQTDSNLKIVPCIAKQWEISSDGLTYIFHLRNDVFFHNNTVFKNGTGRKLIADDVVYSFNRLMDSTIASPGSWVFKGKVDSLIPFSAANDSTFVLKLNKPFMSLLGILSMQYCFIVPHEAVEKFGKDFRNHPVGTGPFQFQYWKENEALTLLRNPNYFEFDGTNHLPFLDGVYITFIDNKIGEFLEFKRGGLDFVSDVDVGMRNDLLTPAGELNINYQGKIRLQKSSYLNTEYIGFNLTDSTNHLLTNVKLRQALSYAIDRKALVTYLRNNVGYAGNDGFVPIGLKGYNSTLIKGFDYNPVLAKNLLAEAGYPNGKNLEALTLKCSSTAEAMCNFLAAEWKDIGVTIKVEVMQSKALNQEMRKGTVQLFRASWLADYPDPESFLSLFYSQNGAPPNYTRFQNLTFDKEYEQCISQTNDSLRLFAYQHLDSLAISQCPVIVLYYDQVLRFVNPRISGFTNNALNLLDLRRVKKSRS